MVPAFCSRLSPRGSLKMRRCSRLDALIVSAFCFGLSMHRALKREFVPFLFVHSAFILICSHSQFLPYTGFLQQSNLFCIIFPCKAWFWTISDRSNLTKLWWIALLYFTLLVFVPVKVFFFFSNHITFGISMSSPWQQSTPLSSQTQTVWADQEVSNPIW